MKIALLAVIPRASEKKAMMVKPGTFASIRMAYFKSVSTIACSDLLRAQRLDRIDKCGAAGWQKACEERGGGEQHGRSSEQCRIVGGDLIERRGNQATEGKGGGKPDR